MLNSRTINDILNTLENINPQKIILFGSYAYGVPEKNSDIDFLIIKNIPETEVRDLRVKIKKLLWNKFKQQSLSFDVVVDSEQRIRQRIRLGDLFYDEIFNNGNVIYAQ